MVPCFPTMVFLSLPDNKSKKGGISELKELEISYPLCFMLRDLGQGGV